mmetsp:Transcript_96124/g.206222  ORF Transcript_96124/g.206222 Transcript_96124/m.206222 type:complete len:275 (-) Transcript_96124:54-878(-)
MRLRGWAGSRLAKNLALLVLLLAKVSFLVRAAPLASVSLSPPPVSRTGSTVDAGVDAACALAAEAAEGPGDVLPHALGACLTAVGVAEDDSLSLAQLRAKRLILERASGTTAADAASAPATSKPPAPPPESSLGFPARAAMGNAEGEAKAPPPMAPRPSPPPALPPAPRPPYTVARLEPSPTLVPLRLDNAVSAAQAAAVASTRLDCAVSLWSEWSDCVGNKDQDPDGVRAYYRARSRVVTSPWRLGGRACPSLFERRYCNYEGPDIPADAWKK